MANYNTVITNEGAALLALVIANQGTLTLTEMRFSTNDYSGSEATLTYGTFSGVFISAAAAGSVVDSTTIKAASQFDNSTLVGDNPLYSIGLVGTDGNTTALIAVSTTTAPDIIRPAVTGVSTYAFNMNLTVSSTNNITVVGTTAAALYDIDVVDTLISTATDKPLSANMGRVLGKNVEAIVDVYGAKNLNVYPYYETTKSENGITYTDNGDGTITISGISSGNSSFFFNDNVIDAKCKLKAGSYKFNGFVDGGSSTTYRIYVLANYGNGNEILATITDSSDVTFNVASDVYIRTYIYISSGNFSTPVTIKPMIRDARIIDDTFVPYAKTNQQLTANVSGLSNRNLLDNPWFTVNQRGATTITSGYGADRWKRDLGTLVFSSSGMQVDHGQATQPFEAQLPNGTYTASVLYSDGTIESGTFTKTDDTTFYKPINNSNALVGYSGTLQAFLINTDTPNTSKTLRAVKLEVGLVSTLHLDLAPDPTTELLKCMRYFTRINFSSGQDIILCANEDTTYAKGVLYFPVEMITTPDLVYSGTFEVSEGGTSHAVSSLSYAARTTQKITIIGLTTALTTGFASLLKATSAAYIDLSADL